MRMKSSVPASRTYSSSTPQQQVTFYPKTQRIKRRASTPQDALKQQTLTQIVDFVDPDMSSSIGEDECEPQSKVNRSKRRRTMGDVPSSSCNYHTQTLTQILTPTFDENERTTPDRAAFRKPSSRDTSRRARAKANKRIEPDTSSASTYHKMNTGQPRTPSKLKVREIPSSQSPATPASVRSIKLEISRSPLEEKCANICEPPLSPSIHDATFKVPKLEIQNTLDWEDESQLTYVPSSPMKKSSPNKTVRFATRLDFQAPSNTGRHSPSIFNRPRVVSSPLLTSFKTEILDSDESDDELEASDIEFGTQVEGHSSSIIQAETDSEAFPSSQLLPVAARQQATLLLHQDQESQRLSRKELLVLSDRSDRTDIIISIHPEHLANIVSGTKDHEFRSYLIPHTVKRMWFYETKPSSSLKFMAVISNGRRPGDIDGDSGVDNAKFNTTALPNRYAYEIQELYQLCQPLDLNRLKADEIIKAPPQKYHFLEPATVDEMISMLEKRVRPMSPTLSESQELEAQLQNSLLHSTQSIHNISEPKMPRPSQASTVDLSHPFSPDRRSQSLIPESPIAPPSSPPYSMLPPRYVEPQDADLHRGRVLTSLSFLPSSQLLTRSQMLPDSLMEDSGPSPPMLVDDSEAEDDV
jgi:hypothetical protein